MILFSVQNNFKRKFEISAAKKFWFFFWKFNFSKCHKMVKFGSHISWMPLEIWTKWQNMFFDLTSTGICRGENVFSAFFLFPKSSKWQKKKSSRFLSEDLPKSFDTIFSSVNSPIYLLTTSGPVCNGKILRTLNFPKKEKNPFYTHSRCWVTFS